jgi:hypothetical protein
MGDDPRFIFFMWSSILLVAIGAVYLALTSSFPWVP